MLLFSLKKIEGFDKIRHYFFRTASRNMPWQGGNSGHSAAFGAGGCASSRNHGSRGKVGENRWNCLLLELGYSKTRVGVSRK
jgi:hypothetical protein